MTMPGYTLEQRYRGKPVRRMHVMVKPTGALCNLDCTYCYNLSKQQLLGKPQKWRISDTVLETFIRQYFDPMEKMDPESKEYGYIGRVFFARKM
jgi:sulfatase maturation enzyme AslB (radical SAM superfamily)